MAHLYGLTTKVLQAMEEPPKEDEHDLDAQNDPSIGWIQANFVPAKHWLEQNNHD